MTIKNIILVFFFWGGQKTSYSMSCVSISQGCRQVVFLLSNKAAWRALGRWPLATFAGRICQRHGTLSPTTSTDNLHRRKQARSLMQQWLQASPNRRYLLCWHWRTTSIPRLPRAIDAAFARWHGPPPPHHRALKQGPYAGGDAGGKFLRENWSWCAGWFSPSTQSFN